MNLFNVDLQPGAHVCSCAGFDSSVSDPIARREARTAREALRRATARGASLRPIRKLGGSGDFLVFSGASRLTRFVQTTQVSMKGDN